MRGTKSRVKNLLSAAAIKGVFYFELDLDNGTHIRLVATSLPTLPVRFIVGQVKQVSRMMLLIERPKEPARGIALSCSEMSLGGKDQNIDAGNFEFRIEEGVVKTSPIRAPETFKWVKTPKGIVPAYHD